MEGRERKGDRKRKREGDRHREREGRDRETPKEGESKGTCVHQWIPVTRRQA